MSAERLSRRAWRAPPGLPLLGPLTLAPARVHEFCGPARRTLALIAAQAGAGPVFWITPGWGQDRLNAEGVAALIDPGRLVFIAPRRGEDLMWCMEESLRAGVVPLVVCELPGRPGLTPVRRLHLAAETAARERGMKPLGLLLIAGDGGAPGVESRWHMGFDHEPGLARWRLERRRARMAPPAAWQVTRDRGGAFALTPARAPEMA
jgi:protein ImuA